MIYEQISFINKMCSWFEFNFKMVLVSPFDPCEICFTSEKLYLNEGMWECSSVLMVTCSRILKMSWHILVSRQAPRWYYGNCACERECHKQESVCASVTHRKVSMGSAVLPRSTLWHAGQRSQLFQTVINPQMIHSPVLQDFLRSRRRLGHLLQTHQPSPLDVTCYSCAARVGTHSASNQVHPW